jgi:hypothetical protein
MPTSFGQVIPVTGPNLGFPGTISRFADRIVAARVFTPFTSTNNLSFGDPAVLIPNVTGGVFDSIKDFVAHSVANAGLVASYFAGFAVREVQSALTYNQGTTPGLQQVGYYQAGQMSEVAERTSGTIQLSVGAPSAGDTVYSRILANAAVPAGTVGDWETNPAATDLFALTGATAANAGDTAITITATGVYVGQLVSGSGVQAGTYVVSGTGTAGSYSAIVLSKALTIATTTTTPFTFSNLAALPNVVARTGFVDANNMLEITIKSRDAA